MIQDRLSLCNSAFSRKSSTSMFPFSVDFVTTTFMPAITALAGLVPCAEDGIKQMFLCWSPLDSWYALITINPAYSPCAPEFGCNEVAANPVILVNWSSSSFKTVWYPCACSIGTKELTLPQIGYINVNISVDVLHSIVSA